MLSVKILSVIMHRVLAPREESQISILSSQFVKTCSVNKVTEAENALPPVDKWLRQILSNARPTILKLKVAILFLPFHLAMSDEEKKSLLLYTLSVKIISVIMHRVLAPREESQIYISSSQFVKTCSVNKVSEAENASPPADK